MSEKKEKKRKDAQALERIAKIRERIGAITHICSGSLQRRKKVCGKSTCRCAHDPDARHGPYYQWSRLVDGKLIHRVVSPEHAKILRQAIANYRKIKLLLRRWEQETLQVIAGIRY